MKDFKLNTLGSPVAPMSGSTIKRVAHGLILIFFPTAP